MCKSVKSCNETLVKWDMLALFKLIRCTFVFKSGTENMCFLRKITVYALRGYPPPPDYSQMSPMPTIISSNDYECDFCIACQEDYELCVVNAAPSPSR